MLYFLNIYITLKILEKNTFLILEKNENCFIVFEYFFRILNNPIILNNYDQYVNYPKKYSNNRLNISKFL
jgi:hypothetical protein